MSQARRLALADPASVEHAVAIGLESLRSGGVVLLPTDTVYGLMCLPTRPDAVRAIYSMKRRPSERRLPIIVANLEHGIRSLPLDWTPAARALARAFWPGALTIACRVLPDADGWLAGRDEAAVRAPRHAVVQALAQALGPLLMTSANRHGAATPHTVDAALEDLAEPPALALDGGRLSGASSTVVNVNRPQPVIEREGAVAASEIAGVLGER